MLGLEPPPVAGDVDLRDFKFMPLEVERLRRSRAWLRAKRQPELAFYMINLWCCAWHNVPAGSLEDDDDVLADLAMCSQRTWIRVRAQVLQGWHKCDDGRLYHGVVVEKVREAWTSKSAYRARTAAAREAKALKRAGSGLCDRAVPEPEPALSRARDAAPSGDKGQEQRQEQREGQEQEQEQGEGEREGEGEGTRGAIAAIVGVIDRAAAIWFPQEGRSPHRDDAGIIAAWLAEGASAGLVAEVCERQFRRLAEKGLGLPIRLSLIDRDVRGALAASRRSAHSAGAKPPPPFRPPGSDQRLIWRARLTGFQRTQLWLTSWGPRPDESGCEAPCDLLAETGS